jgi:hypothetical protein
LLSLFDVRGVFFFIRLLPSRVGAFVEALIQVALVGPGLRLIFARIAPADAPGVLFDLSEGGVERGMRPLLYARHGFQSVARWANRKLIGGALCDTPHRATEQVRQPPNGASLRPCDDHIHTKSRFRSPHASDQSPNEALSFAISSHGDSYFSANRMLCFGSVSSGFPPFDLTAAFGWRFGSNPRFGRGQHSLWRR